MVAYLNIHTAYDLLNSSLKITDAVEKAKREGVDTLAITDTNVLYGYPKFYDACIEAGIHPVFGMTVLLTDGLYQIETVLLAQNNDGLKDLYQLSSAIKMKEKVDISIDWLKRYEANLIIIFKNAEEQHQQLIESFDFKQHVYINQNSVQINNRECVWLNTARYLNKEDADTITALQAIKDNSKLDLVGEQEDFDEHFYTSEEIHNLGLDTSIFRKTDE